MDRDTKFVVELVDQFFQNPFGFQEAQDRFGTPDRETGDRIHLRPPPKSGIEQVVLEKARIDEIPATLAGISLQFHDPISVDFGELARRYGPEEETPRLKPTEEIPYQFQIKTKDYQGYVLLKVVSRTRSSWRSVSSVIVRRFPLEEP